MPPTIFLPLKIIQGKKWPNLQSTITPEIFFRIYSKVNQVINQEEMQLRNRIRTISREKTLGDAICSTRAEPDHYFKKQFLVRVVTQGYQTCILVGMLCPAHISFHTFDNQSLNFIITLETSSLPTSLFYYYIKC